MSRILLVRFSSAVCLLWPNAPCINFLFWSCRAIILSSTESSTINCGQNKILVNSHSIYSRTSMGFQVIQYQMQLNIGLNFFKIKDVLSNTNKQQTSRSLCDKKSIIFHQCNTKCKHITIIPVQVQGVHVQIRQPTFVMITSLVCPSRWHLSKHCSSDAGFQALVKKQPTSLILNK